MKTQNIRIDNLKCGGCANTIKKNLEKIEGVASVEVDVEKSEVAVTHQDTLDRAVLVEKLAKLGYPEAGTGNVLQKAKSYVSCAVGKISA